MKIREHESKHYVPLKDLKAGDTFELLGKYYIKTNCGFDEQTSCVSITDGDLLAIAKDKKVTPIIIEGVVSHKEDRDGISDNT